MQTKKRAIPHYTFRPRYQRSGLKGGGKSRPHSGRPDRPANLFSAGESVRQTGIYEVIHDRSHRVAHEVVMLNGDSFPACDTCEERVRFRLIRTAPYIFQDEDFGEPS
jgi:hypothetical protein